MLSPGPSPSRMLNGSKSEYTKHSGIQPYMTALTDGSIKIISNFVDAWWLKIWRIMPSSSVAMYVRSADLAWSCYLKMVCSLQLTERIVVYDNFGTMITDAMRSASVFAADIMLCRLLHTHESGGGLRRIVLLQILCWNICPCRPSRSTML